MSMYKVGGSVSERTDSSHNITVSKKENEFVIGVTDIKQNVACKVEVTCENGKLIVDEMKNFMAKIKKNYQVISEIIDKITEISIEIKSKEILGEVFHKDYKERALAKTRELQKIYMNEPIKVKTPIPCMLYMNNDKRYTNGVIFQISMKNSTVDIEVNGTKEIIKNIHFNNLCFADYKTGEKNQTGQCKDVLQEQQQKGGAKNKTNFSKHNGGFLNSNSPDVDVEEYVTLCE